ncbi:MAG: hypothetical protein ACLTS6_06995 [Anaerobutyricum sp.]
MIIKEEKESQEEGNQEKDSSDYKDKEEDKQEVCKKEVEKDGAEDVINNTVGTQEEKNEVIPRRTGDDRENKVESRTEKEEGSEDISIKDAKGTRTSTGDDRKSAIEGGRREGAIRKSKVDIRA